MKVDDARKSYLAFFEKRGHSVIPSASLVPENDPTTLFTGSGMQPLLPYLLGERHPKGKRLVNSQKCFRAEDIEEVGDNRHTTFFEMLGNWSLGDYFKREQLPWFFEFLTGKEEGMGLDPERLYVTVFAGDEETGIPRDDESVAIWKRLFAEVGIEATDALIGSEEEGYRHGMRRGKRIFYYDAKNWWSRAGAPEKMPSGEPGGPDSEVFFDFGTEHDTRFGEHCHPNCDCGRFLEIGNSVFMEYAKQENGSFKPLSQKNVDFGAGLERIVAASNDDADVFNVDSLRNIIGTLEEKSGKSYITPELQTSFRVIADHIRAAIFMIGDGVHPSNTEQGYFVRRLIRRSMIKARNLDPTLSFSLGTLVQPTAENYAESYPKLSGQKESISAVIDGEEAKFRKTIERGLKEFEKVGGSTISGRDAFVLFSTYGFPLELTLGLALERGVSVDTEGFKKEMEEHRKGSHAGAEQKFRGGLADHSDKVVQYHTATHLLLAGLRKELGEGVHQAGSNITAERTRFDFTYPEKVGRDVLDRVEMYVNRAIRSNATVAVERMKKEDARKDPSVEGSFWERYPDEVSVYSVVGSDGTVYSRELCGGPHVTTTKGMGTFKVVKEEASSAGVRRIKAILT